MESIRWHGGVLTCAAVLAIGTGGRAQPPMPAGCNPTLVRAGGANGYGVRGTTTKWCEGTFTGAIGNPELKLEAFTQPVGVDSAAALLLDTLVVEWNAPPGVDVRLVARFRQGQFYQLDAVGKTDATGTGVWRWPVGILKNELRAWPIPVSGVAPEPAVLVLASAQFKGDTISIPVRIRSRTSVSARNRQFQVRMFVTEPIVTRRAVVTRFDSLKNRTDTLAMDRPCKSIGGGGTGRSLIRITLCMPASAPAGIYRLSLSADSDGMSMRKPPSIPFYYAPPTSSP